MAHPHDQPLPASKRVPTWHVSVLIALPVLALAVVVATVVVGCYLVR